MKLKYLLLGFSFCMILFLSCKDETIRLESMDNVAPGPVSNVTWASIPGGAVFRYTLPDDEDLLYVKAVFTRANGVQAQASATIYSDSLKIEGFGDVIPKEVQLFAVDRSSNESLAVQQTITPGVPDIFNIGKSLEVKADFGGVHAFWENVNKQNISVVILKKDNNDEFVPLETYYSSIIDGDGLYIGMDTIPIDCAVYAQDRWENRTEIKYFPNLTPIFETLLDRTKFKAESLPNDAKHVNNWQVEKVFDGVKANNSGYSSIGGTGIWPQWITIDMGVKAKISRIRLFQRMEGYTYAEGNLKDFEIWGYNTKEEMDWTGAWDNWLMLMKCHSIKPSGLPLGQNTDEDTARARNGEDFYGSPDNPGVRYIRIKALRTWAGGDNFQVNEIEIFGDNREDKK